MSINIDFLDFLYTGYFDALAEEVRLQKNQDLPDDPVIICEHTMMVDQAKREVSKSRNRIYAYIEHHGGAPV